MGQIVHILHADDVADPPPFRDLGRGDVAEPDVAHQTLPLKPGQNRKRRFDRPFGRPVDPPHDPEVDDLDRIEPETAEIVVDRALELGRRHRRDPRCVLAAPGADLGDDDEIGGIGMECLADQLIGDIGTVIVAGVDVIDAARHRLAQHRDRAARGPSAARTRPVPRAASRRSPCASRCGRRA